MRILLSILGLAVCQMCFSQQWVDTTFQITTTTDIVYGEAVDFKGANYLLDMDISVPVDDTPPECGRPLMVVVHGGAWYAGDKAEGYPVRLRQDFAKRGYVTASVNYRLGLFNTHQQIDCVLLDGWKCWNMADTIEWYRANYRAIQDVRGAIRYLVNNRADYNIDPDNVFLVGESAGGFVVLGAGFIDDPSEILAPLVDEYPDVQAPHAIYEARCIRTLGLADSIEEMDLSRPALGDVEGETNLPLEENYQIRAVGNIYGGVFNNIFATHASAAPALYLYHQPCDLIVPFNYNRLLAGYSFCATGFPSFCQYIINRPFSYGSKGITTLIDSLVANNVPAPDYYFDNSGNSYSCLEQVANPSIGCHAIDSYWLRTNNMATYFSDKINACSITSSADLSSATQPVLVYPNPTDDWLSLRVASYQSNVRVRLYNLAGIPLDEQLFLQQNELRMDVSKLASGYYLVSIEVDDQIFFASFVKS